MCTALAERRQWIGDVVQAPDEERCVELPVGERQRLHVADHVLGEQRIRGPLLHHRLADVEPDDRDRRRPDDPRGIDAASAADVDDPRARLDSEVTHGTSVSVRNTFDGCL